MFTEILSNWEMVQEKQIQVMERFHSEDIWHRLVSVWSSWSSNIVLETFHRRIKTMLILTQHLNKAGGIRIRTNSGDIWLAMQPGHTGNTCRIAIDAPKDFEILRSELISPKEIGRNCSPNMMGLLSGSLQKKRKTMQRYGTKESAPNPRQILCRRVRQATRGVPVIQK